MRKFTPVAVLLGLSLAGCGGSEPVPSQPSTADASSFDAVHARWSSGECPDPATMAEQIGFGFNETQDHNPLFLATTSCGWGDPEYHPAPDETYTSVAVWVYDTFEQLQPVERQGRIGGEISPLPEYGPDSFAALSVDSSGPDRCEVTLVDADTERAVMVWVVAPPRGTNPCEAALAVAELP